MSDHADRQGFRSRLEVLAEELEEAVIESVEAGDLTNAAGLWAASAAVWSAADQLGQSAGA